MSVEKVGCGSLDSLSGEGARRMSSFIGKVRRGCAATLNVSSWVSVIYPILGRGSSR
jgi:hypothetical protein